MAIRNLMIQATPRCNMNCSYCYISESSRQNNSIISEETLEAIYQKILTSFLVSSELTILWHAGEPLMIPISFYEKAFNTIEKYNQPGNKIIQCIQTNGTLINEAWC